MIAVCWSHDIMWLKCAMNVAGHVTSCDPSMLLVTQHHISLPPVESVNNFIGLGFAGYDEKGQPVWGVCQNIRVFDVEVGNII